jgi:hypothetical protein
MLVLTPTEHILRGFLFERTVERGSYYFWRVVMPLYRPANAIFLNYSLRIPNGEKLRISRQELEVVSDRILEIVRDGNLRYIHELQRPKDFLEHISGMVGSTPTTFRLDLALTHYMLGNVRQCIQILEEIAPDIGTLASKGEAVTALLDDLKTSPVKAAHRIAAWERANIQNLGLSEAVVGAVQ